MWIYESWTEPLLMLLIKYIISLKKTSTLLLTYTTIYILFLKIILVLKLLIVLISLALH
jgi:hypothetical protein